MIENININRVFLQSALSLQGPDIAKRWKKISLKKREDLLMSIDPGMYDRKWHEVHIQ